MNLTNISKKILSLLFVILLFISGCGGSKNHKSSAPAQSGSTNQSNEQVATAKLNINWPAVSTAEIPSGTNRIIISVSGPYMNGAVNYVIDKPTNNSSTLVEIKVPAGAKRLFSAQARKVAKAEYQDITRVSNTKILNEGELLGSGNNTTAFDILPWSTVNVDLKIVPKSTPPQKTNVGNPTKPVNPADPSSPPIKNLEPKQIISERFPAILTFELFQDDDGNPITDLSINNVKAYETIGANRQEAFITDVRTALEARTGLNVVLILDRSGSMGGKTSQATTDLKKAACSFVDFLGNDDLCEVIHFSSGFTNSGLVSKRSYPLIDDINNDPSIIDGGTKLYEAIYKGLTDIINNNNQSRSAIIAMTDGRPDSSDRTNFQGTVIEMAEKNHIPIYTIGLGNVDESELSYLAKVSGGKFFLTPNSEQLKSIYTTLAGQIQGEVQITYISPTPEKIDADRKVEIVITYGRFTDTVVHKYHY